MPTDTNAADAQATNTETQDNAAAEETLNEGGVKALRAERDARKAADARVKDLEAQVAALTVNLDEAKATATSAAEEAATQVADLQTQLARLQVIHEKAVPDALAEFVQGTTAEELAASAEKLLAAIPAPAPASDAAPAPLAMRPDPSQGGAPEPATTTDALTAMLIEAVGGR